MAGYNPQAAAAKQIKRAQSATQDYKDGVARVTEAPTAKAARKLDKYRAGVLEALDSGKTQQALLDTSLSDWQKAAQNKGGARYAAGVAESADKINGFHQQFASFIEGHKAEMDRLPDATPEDRINKMVANVRGISKFRYRKGMR